MKREFAGLLAKTGDQISDDGLENLAKFRLDLQQSDSIQWQLEGIVDAIGKEKTWKWAMKSIHSMIYCFDDTPSYEQS